jgi:two-component system, sensor histidine kinase
MTPAQVEKLFQPFTKIMQNRNLNKEGVGLGLAVCKKLALALNGDIFVESKLEEGSKFTLCIPLILLTSKDELLQGHVLPV